MLMHLYFNITGADEHIRFLLFMILKRSLIMAKGSGGKGGGRAGGRGGAGAAAYGRKMVTFRDVGKIPEVRGGGGGSRSIDVAKMMYYAKKKKK